MSKRIVLMGNRSGFPALSSAGFFASLRIQGSFHPPSTLDDALIFVDQLHALPHCLTIVPGEHHWKLFTQLCRAGGARGGLVTDAYLAALARESGSELVTADRGFGRWPGVRWRHP